MKDGFRFEYVGITSLRQIKFDFLMLNNNNNNNKMKKTYGNQVGINKLCVTKVCLDEIPVKITFA